MLEPNDNTNRDESPIANRRSPAKRRGGRRPGAGAPRGNMNALKTGAYSKQFSLLGKLLAQDPTVRAVLLNIAARAERKFKDANEVAAYLLVRYAEHVEAAAKAKYAPRNGNKKVRPEPGRRGDGLNIQVPVDDWDSIKRAAARHEQKTRK